MLALAHKTEIRPDRKAQLIDAALEVIAADGLSRTTVAKVAQQAGLSQGIVGFYFKSKDAMLLATLSHLAEEFDAALRAAIEAHADDPCAALRAVIRMQFDERIADPRKTAVWSAFWGETRARGDYLEVCGEKDRAHSETLTSLCRRVAQLGGYSHVSIEAIARGLDGVMDGLLQDMLIGAEEVDADYAIRTCEAFLASVFPEHFSLREAIDVEQRPADAAPRLLAPWTYFDEEFLALEKEHLFERHWLMACHVSDVPAPGDYTTLDLLGERALVLRGDDGEVRAFHNVCRHRGSRVVRHDHGNCPRALVCPFHGWSYDLRGKLRGIPAARSFGPMDERELGLVPIETEVWQGHVFIRFGGEQPPVAEIMAPIAEEVAPYRFEEMEPVAPVRRQEVPVNWKSLHDIDNEGYHIAVGHPSLNTLLEGYADEDHPHGLAVSRAALMERPSKHWSVRHYQRLLPRFEHLPETKQRAWLYWALFPNVSFGVYPDMMEYYQTFPLSAGRTMLLSRRYALPDDRREARAARYLNQRINDRVGAEDLTLVQWSYEAMRSSVFPRDRLSSIEGGVADFHDAIRAILPVASLEEPPAAGTLSARNRAMA